VVFRGAHPDDLAFDLTGHLLFSDYTNGTISRLESPGHATVLHRGLAGPEGMVVLADGTLVVAEEKTNHVLAFSPGSSVPTVLRDLPGTPSLLSCHQGVDGIAWDPTTKTLIVPDAPSGTVYRMTSDGATLTPLAHGFVHPVGAAVDRSGAVLVADECGGDVWRVTATGGRVRVAPGVMPDDVAVDRFGNILVTDVRHTRHSLYRYPAGGGTGTLLAASGLVEPQGLAIAADGSIYVSDDLADVILRLTPPS
jgi:sugar lactone lactonase YvrE